MTAAGAMALSNAAQLAGLVLSQLKREGSPLILCGRSGGFMDMRTMVSIYTAPDAGPCGWDLARHYRIPTFTAACTDAKIFDAQAAGETALTLFDRADFETWSSKGSLTLQQKANQRVLEIIGSHRAKALHPEVKAKLADVVARK